MLPSLAAAVLGALTFTTLVTAAPAPVLEKRVVLGSPVDGCKVGSHKVGGTCTPINTCLFASVKTLLGATLDLNLLGNLVNAKLDLGKVLDISTNTCISVDSCLSVKSSTVVSQTVAGIVGVQVCKRPTCSGLTVLNINTGICECPLDHIWSNGDKKVCIKRSSCNSLLNNIVDGVCIPKICAAGTVLLSAASDKTLALRLGTCIELDLCTRIGVLDSKKGICKQKSCSKGHILNTSTGACECPTGNGYLLSGINADICIKASACSKTSNTIAGNLCIPKICAAGQVLLGSATEKSLVARVGACIDLNLCGLIGSIDSKTGVCHQKKCSSDKILNVSDGLCICAAGKLLNSAGLCINLDTCNPLLNNIVGGLCQPKKCDGPLVLNSSGLCICPVGHVLNKISNSCISINLCQTHKDGVCTLLKGVVHAVDNVVDGVGHAVGAIGLGVNAAVDAALKVKIGH